MRLFDKLKGKKGSVDWNDAYNAAPKFYGRPDASPFGAIALTEGTKTVLPKNPQLEYKVDGKSVAEWKLILVSTSKDTIIGDVDYFVALKKVEQYSLDTNKNAILIRKLSLAELEGLRG
ncbi:MAG: DUF4299 family protein [Lachnospiraceae bacterium]